MAITLANRLHSVVIDTTQYVRERLGTANIGRFHLIVNVSGRTMTDEDECKIEYQLSAGYDCTVKGNELFAVVDEVMRRHGWDQRNAPKALPKPKVVA